ncbi:MAG: NAD(P)/FAD-dependent oxidoreductase [Eubacteriaceae bacterium]
MVIIESVDYDVIIIGGGPAGLAASIYCARSGLKTLIIEEDITGGLANNSYNIENYPGFVEGITGFELMDLFYQQAIKIGVEFKYEQVIEINEKKEIKLVSTIDNLYSSYVIIIATGGSPNKTKALNEEKYIGKGISFCTLCDAPQTRDKNVVVIGSGDSAIDQSIYLANFAKKVIIVSINEEGEFDSTDIDKINLLKKKNIEFLWNYEVYKFEGNSGLTNIILKNIKDKSLIDIECEHSFEFIGYKPNSSLFTKLLSKDEDEYIVTNDFMETEKSGIYAIGDVRKKVLKQIATATSDGAISGVMAKKYIDSLKTIKEVFNNNSIIYFYDPSTEKDREFISELETIKVKFPQYKYYSLNINKFNLLFNIIDITEVPLVMIINNEKQIFVSADINELYQKINNLN